MRREASTKAGEYEVMRYSYHTIWRESVSHDDACSNRFPVEYGKKLTGKREQALDFVKAMPLSRQVVYEVSTTTGATGYGVGKFIIRNDGRVDNLPRHGSSELRESAN